MKSEVPCAVKKITDKDHGDGRDPHGPALQKFAMLYPGIVSCSLFCQPFLCFGANVFFADDSVLDEEISCSN